MTQPTTRRPRTASPEEAELFRATLRDVKPLRRRSRAVPASEPAPVETKRAAAPAVSHPARAQPKIPPRTPTLAPLDATYTSRGSARAPAPGIDKRTHERFTKGEMAIDARLDLHGMTQDAAHAALLRFVERSAAAGLRCLLIVTGKGTRDGTGVLKAQVPRWLNEAGTRPYLLAIHRARPQHGGDGALYVLLKRKR